VINLKRNGVAVVLRSLNFGWQAKDDCCSNATIGKNASI
jgi:hypothetical protein